MNQREIAKVLGVSQTTVSFVLNDPKTQKVSESKRDLILDYLRSNGFSANIRGEAKTIAYLFPEKIGNDLYHSFYERFINGVESAATHAGYNIVIEKYRKDNIVSLPRQKVDGVIFESAIDSNDLKLLAKRYPTVLLNYSLCEPICDMVAPDNRGGVELAMSYLREQGHQRIAYFALYFEAAPYETNSCQRLEAFKSSISPQANDWNNDFIQVTEPKSLSVEAVDEVINESLRLWGNMKKPPTAVLCFNDIYALRMIRQANLLGIKVPEELSIIGIDNIPLSELSFPALTSIDHNVGEMGKLSIEMLLERIKNPDRPTRKVCCNASLVIRESVKKTLNKESEK